MGAQYSVASQPVQVLLGWIEGKQIAIPEIQRPFVWDASQVRDLLDSLYRGYPVGYLICWTNPNLQLRDGTTAAGKRILIDGQQRIIALTAALAGRPVLTKGYKKSHIKIAFEPNEEIFEVSNPVLTRDKRWLPDVSVAFRPGVSSFALVTDYCEKNPGSQPDEISAKLTRLQNIANNQIGVIDLAVNLDIDTVTEIFIRVNSQGTTLSQADFAMSKISANEEYKGNTLRKAIDYFCHASVNPTFIEEIADIDSDFASTDYYAKMRWLAGVFEDLYDPNYTDMLRVAFSSQFRRGKLKDLVALLSGRNFETKQYEASIAEASFENLSQGILRYMDQPTFLTYLQIIKSAGFINKGLISSQNALNVSYAMFLIGQEEGIQSLDLQSIIRRWFVLATLTGRYSGSADSSIDQDIRQVTNQGLQSYTKIVIDSTFTDSYWQSLLPQEMDTSAALSPYWLTFLAAQVFDNAPGFLSAQIRVASLIQDKGDTHHVFPKAYLQKMGVQRGQYNQIANYVKCPSDVNRLISDKPPAVYFAEVKKQLGKSGRLSHLPDEKALEKNLSQNAIPLEVLEAEIPYEDFLIQRRRLMSRRIGDYVARL